MNPNTRLHGTQSLGVLTSLLPGSPLNVFCAWSFAREGLIRGLFLANAGLDLRLIIG